MTDRVCFGGNFSMGDSSTRKVIKGAALSMWNALGSPYALIIVATVLLALFSTLFYLDRDLYAKQGVLRNLIVNAERILGADYAATASVRQAAAMESKRYLVGYDDQVATRQSLLAFNFAEIDSPGIKQTFDELTEIQGLLDTDEADAIELINEGAWEDALEIVTSKAFKRDKGLYRAKLSQALRELIFESERSSKHTADLRTATQGAVIAAFVLLLLLGYAYYKRIQSNLKREMDLVDTLEVRVAERTQELSERTQELSGTHDVITSSIQYASRIQRALLPSDGVLHDIFAEHFCIWEPRDVVGGDMYWVREDRRGYFVSLFDCTGHGVPGALMTTIAVSALSVAFAETGDPSRLIARVNKAIKLALGQHDEEGPSDDGLEMGICLVEPERMRVTYAGARFELVSAVGDSIEVIKGDKNGLGYRHVPFDCRFTNHSIRLKPGQRLYMHTDGIIDQIGGNRRRAFGRKRLMKLLGDTVHMPLPKQGAAITSALADYQGGEVRRDDVSMIGFMPTR